jgi:hypothetical protein
LDDWGPEDWLQPSWEKVQALLLFFQQYFSYHPPALSDSESSSMAADYYSSDARYTSDVFSSVLECSDDAPSFMPDFQSSERDTSDLGNRKLGMEIHAFLQQVFPAVRGAGAPTEDQKQAAQKRRKIRELLRLPAMGKGNKAK